MFTGGILEASLFIYLFNQLQYTQNTKEIKRKLPSMLNINNMFIKKNQVITKYHRQ